MQETLEKKRLEERSDNRGWKKWGPYLSARQWGTVREDYSVYGDSWNYVSHDISRSRTYRWGEDGIGGISDNKQHICFAFSFWNHADPLLKERYFGLTGAEGNHGEDVKELYYYLDSTPTHSYMKMLYKYPIKLFPYEEILQGNRERGKKDKEFEILNTEAFNDNQYFDIYIEYAKKSENDILIKLTAHNRSNKAAKLAILPTLWFRNTWSWGYEDFAQKPMLTGIAGSQVEVRHQFFDNMKLYLEGADELLFSENETNMKRVFNKKNETPFVKDSINDYVVDGVKKAVNKNNIGTKMAGLYDKEIPAESSVEIRLRFSNETHLEDAFGDFDQIFNKSKADADDFYGEVQKDVKGEEQKEIQRQAFAGMMWNKQFYYYNMDQWANGDPKMPFKFTGRAFTRNDTWKHAYMHNILSMPDKWEYPWFAAWDLAFHTVTLARIDTDFAKRQLAVVLREYYMHPNGQIPAYEWNFSDVNPPVHAWATWKVYEIDKEQRGGKGDIAFLERIFHKLLLNFTWWVNQKDEEGNNIFGGGFLGLDNIGVFDRNAQIPGIQLQQADATGWMAIFTLNMLRISCEISLERPVYQDMASKFFEHFLHIAAAINNNLEDGTMGLWDEEDQFYYDKIQTPEARTIFLKVRSLVGLIPLCAVEVINQDLLDKLPEFKKRLEWVLNNRPDLASLISRWHEPGKGETHLLSLLRGHRMKMVLKKLFDEAEFLSDYGIRSLSKFHKEHPFGFDLHGEHLEVSYSPAETELSIMGGNSNWRGPIWFPLNYLIIDALHKYSQYYGDDYEVEYPTGSGKITTIANAANEISKRLISIFEENTEGLRPALQINEQYDKDEHFKKYHLFYEYFNGDNGEGCGAAHQTGWTGLVADLIAEVNEFEK
ncbi:MGH1-like glycoside hydrolase domain-containing protein [Arcticibacterium luteifluviistationis]|uniref:Glucosidase n=1 Tax=Arcticibacterium luteifluviistationis TaxID=1784714 RepID=A0A2Z4GCZ1_9BACT|nr:glucosidase [Arcticibacterium luteifluviistationis]AWV98970.1 glucosidase [Arcticibacterium luteifluviistationis]